MSLTGENKVYAGDEITLTYCAGGDIYGGTGKFTYDSSVLSLISATASGKGGCTAQISGSKFMFYKDNLASPIPAGTPILELRFKVSASAAVGTKFSASVTDVVFTDGERDISADGCTYSNSIARPLSTNSYLSSLAITGLTLTPEFSSNVTEYSVEVTEEVEKVEVTAQTQDGNARWKVASNEVAPGETTPINVIVTAENGSTRTYVINVTRPQSSNAALNTLAVEGYTLTPEFSSDVYEYKVTLSDGIIPAINAEAAMSVSTVSVGEFVSEGESVGSISVKVTAQNGTELVYKIILELPPNVTPETTAQSIDSDSTPTTNSTFTPSETIATDNTATSHVNFMLPTAIITGVLAAACAVIFIILAKKNKKVLPPPADEPSEKEATEISETAEAAEASDEPDIAAIPPEDDNLDDEKLDEGIDYND